ncbi:MAG: metallophosphoesterase, partial [Myxococcota bacterium]
MSDADEEVQMGDGLDIVGDIHGQLDALIRLGDLLGYDVHDGWSHPEQRKLVFIGDLIDRGPDSLGVSQLVLSLCRSGRALCLMGNHEFNLIEWRHGRTSAKHSNKPTIEDVERRAQAWHPVLDFFETLPLALELEDLRITHAVWHARCIDELAPVLSTPPPGVELDARWASMIKLYSPYENGALRSGVPTHPFEDQWEKSIDILLKGYETKALVPFTDNDGRERDMIRTQWWLPQHAEVPKDRRIIFGHYWNMPPIAGRHDAFVPPHPSGHPDLRAWFDAHQTAVASKGRISVPKSVPAVCV